MMVYSVITLIILEKLLPMELNTMFWFNILTLDLIVDNHRRFCEMFFFSQQFSRDYSIKYWKNKQSFLWISLRVILRINTKLIFIALGKNPLKSRESKTESVALIAE